MNGGRERGNDVRERPESSADELKILASARFEPKMIETIAKDTQIPLQRCRDMIEGLVDLGVLVIEHDSDLYGHEFVKVRHVRKESDC